MSVIEERNAEILRPQLKLIAQGWSRVLDVPPEVGNRDRVSIRRHMRVSKSRLRDGAATRRTSLTSSDTILAWTTLAMR
jgi:hypothetical protein